jgi:hypothetical protein
MLRPPHKAVETEEQSDDEEKSPGSAGILLAKEGQQDAGAPEVGVR